MKVAVTGANGLLGSEAVRLLCEGAGPGAYLDSAPAARALRSVRTDTTQGAPGGQVPGPDHPPPFAPSVGAPGAPKSRGAPGSEVAPGFEVLALGRGPCRLPPGPYRYVQVDLGDGHSVEAALRAFGAQAVLHAGAATDVDGCERDPLMAWRANVDGTAEVARACRALGARLVAVSTDYVFDGEAGPYDEEARPNPRGAYARSKRCGEEAALLLAPDCAVARVAVVYSGRKGAKPTFATQVVEKLTRGEVVKAFVDQRVSTTLAASGAAMCLELLLEHDYRGVLHLSDAGVCTRVTFAEAVARRFGLTGVIQPVLTADVKLPAPRPLSGGLVVTRAAALLRHKPLRLDEALDRFHAEWTARGGGSSAG